MTEQELNVFLDLEWNCAVFSSEEASVSAPLSPKQWSRIISRHPELQELCPFSEFLLLERFCPTSVAATVTAPTDFAPLLRNTESSGCAEWITGE